MADGDFEVALLSENFLKGLTLVVVLALATLPILSFVALWRARSQPYAAIAVPLLTACVFQAIFAQIPHYIEGNLSHSRAPLPQRYLDLAARTPQLPRTADLHSDALLWRQRDLLVRSENGHVDLPRLEEGRFALQVFALVISSPRDMNVWKNSRPANLLGDHIFVKALIERWPRRSWTSHLWRALVQIERLEDLELRSNGRIVMVRTANDMASGSRTESQSPPILALAALEGATSLEAKLENVDVLFNAGLRLLGPTHFFDTEVGGSQSGVSGGGLTSFGRQVVGRMKELDMIIDLAHSSNAIIDEVTAMADNERPCALLSHTGVMSVCQSPRNVDDERMRKIVGNGGLIGITLFFPALCEPDNLVSSWVKSVVHAISVVGVDGVALGSDFDGGVVTSVHAGQSQVLYAALIQDGGLSEGDAQKVMADNVMAFFQRCLPQS